MSTDFILVVLAVITSCFGVVGIASLGGRGGGCDGGCTIFTVPVKYGGGPGGVMGEKTIVCSSVAGTIIDGTIGIGLAEVDAPNAVAVAVAVAVVKWGKVLNPLTNGWSKSC